MQFDLEKISLPLTVHGKVIVLGRIGYDLYADQKNTPLDQVQSFSRYLGGSAANIAVGLARLQVPTSMISVVSDDPVGKYLKRFLEKEKIDTSMIRTEKDCNNSLSLVEISPPSNFHSVFYRKDCADLRISISDINLERLKQARILLTGGTSLSGHPSRDTVYHALMRHRSEGHINVLDIDYRPALWSSAEIVRIYMRLAVSLSDVVLGTCEELEAVSEYSDPDKIAAEMLQRGAKVVVAKMGEQGAVIYSANEKLLLPPYKIEVVSALGAGDAFAASFCFGLLQGWPLQECGAFANAAGALVATRLTCSTAMPHHHEIIEFIRDHHSDGENH